MKGIFMAEKTMKMRINSVKELLREDFYNRETLFVFAIAFAGGLFAHGYELFAKHPNYDEFISIFHYGGGYNLGRWMLSLIGNFIFRIDGCYSLPWFNGLIFIALIAASSVLFLKPFKLKSKWAEALIALIMMTFPSVTSTLSYMFTAPFYALSIFLAALAFYLTVRFRYGAIIAAFLLCFSMGIYQAFFCLLAVFLLVYTLVEIFTEEDKTVSAILISAGVRLAMMVAGLLMYIVANKVITSVRKVDLSSYQGISNMGRYSAGSIFNALGQCYVKFFKFFTGDYNGLLPYKVLNIALIIGWMVAIFALVIFMVRIVRKSPVKAIFAGICVILLPLGINLIFVMCADSLKTVHSIMCYGMAAMFVIPVILVRRALDDKSLKKAGSVLRVAGIVNAVVLLGVVFLYSKYANISYLAYELHYEQMYSSFETLENKIRNAEGYKDELPLCFVGTYSDEVDLWQLEKTSALAGTYKTSYVMNYGEARAQIFSTYLGYAYSETVPDEAFLSEEEIVEMPCYPDDGSVRVLDDRIVIKFSETAAQ